MDRVTDWALAVARAAKYDFLFLRARQKASGRSAPPPRVRVAFIVGCGRSGTSFLGETLSKHPEVRYLFEPYHLWAAVRPETDASLLYGRVPGERRCIMDESLADAAARRRFQILFGSPGVRSRDSGLLIEKTPINAMRMPFLRALEPSAKFIHLVRDGVAVAFSIQQIAVESTYRMAGRSNYNAWWGVAENKWRVLARDGIEAGHHPSDVDKIDSHAQRGAYEWVVTIREVSKWRARAGNDLLEITYPRLVSQTEEVLTKVAEFLELDPDPQWLDMGTRRVRKSRREVPTGLRLPASICRDFNSAQEAYGFEGRGNPVK